MNDFDLQEFKWKPEITDTMEKDRAHFGIPKDLWPEKPQSMTKVLAMFKETYMKDFQPQNPYDSRSSHPAVYWSMKTTTKNVGILEKYMVIVLKVSNNSLIKFTHKIRMSPNFGKICPSP
jgi:hypothetical protein